MPKHLRISVYFLNGEFHGRGDGGESEWPPSPLRLFQALTNAASRLGGNEINPQSNEALHWLEALEQPPVIQANEATQTNGYQLYVPDNVGDLVAKQWAAGKYFDSKNHAIDISSYRTEKYVRPLRLQDSATVHYIWTLDNTSDSTCHCETLITIARSITHLGWGTDVVVVNATTEERNEKIEFLSFEQWIPVETSGGVSLRTPIAGTLDALKERHTAFLHRIRNINGDNPIFVPVPPLTSFRTLTYRRENELTQPPYAVFSLRKPDDSGYATFDPLRRRLHLTGMLRHTASQPDFATALGWDENKVNSFILGHNNNDLNNTKPTTSDPRLVFIPLPSIEWRGTNRGRTVGLIRRVLVTVQGHCSSTEFLHIIRSLEGRDLIDEKTKQPVAYLHRSSGMDSAIADYITSSSTWTTVTPVVLPGYDDPRKLRQRLKPGNNLTPEEKSDILRKLDQRIDTLLRKAIRQVGYPEALVAHAKLDWGISGSLPGTTLASHYSVPDQHRRYRRLHVRIHWRSQNGRPIKVPGPICIGSGKLSGVGLFAAIT